MGLSPRQPLGNIVIPTVPSKTLSGGYLAPINFRLGNLFVWETYSSGKLIRRGNLFVGETYSSGKLIRRGNLFVGETYSSRELIRRGNLFVGETYSSPNQNVVSFPSQIFP